MVGQGATKPMDRWERERRADTVVVARADFSQSFCPSPVQIANLT